MAGQMSFLVVLERMQCRYIYMYSLYACIISIESRLVMDNTETWNLDFQSSSVKNHQNMVLQTWQKKIIRLIGKTHSLADYTGIH